MHYRIPCACGESVTVAEAAAGSTIPCGCGRVVVVPSLRELRRQAGVPSTAPPPEMVVETLLAAGRLPEETHCILCGTAADGIVFCKAECERAKIVDGRPSFWQWLLSGYLLGLFAVLFLQLARQEKGQEKEVGKDRIYTLPLRICDRCRPELTSPEAIKRAMSQVRLYRRLLEKYPDTRVSMPDS
jgi:hypothetical protein